jgi:hypothetical protein
MLSKSRKSKDAENFANGEFWTNPSLRCFVMLIRRSVVVWSRSSRRTERISGFRKFRLLPVKDFFGSIGQNATFYGVPMTSGLPL